MNAIRSRSQRHVESVVHDHTGTADRLPHGACETQQRDRPGTLITHLKPVNAASDQRRQQRQILGRGHQAKQSR